MWLSEGSCVSEPHALTTTFPSDVRENLDHDAFAAAARLDHATAMELAHPASAWSERRNRVSSQRRGIHMLDCGSPTAQRASRGALRVAVWCAPEPRPVVGLMSEHQQRVGLVRDLAQTLERSPRILV